MGAAMSAVLDAVQVMQLLVMLGPALLERVDAYMLAGKLVCETTAAVLAWRVLDELPWEPSFDSLIGDYYLPLPHDADGATGRRGAAGVAPSNLSTQADQDGHTPCD